MLKRYRSYIIDVTALGALATTANGLNIPIDVSADFYVTDMTSVSTGAFTARFRDNSRFSMFWSDQRIVNTLIFGTAQLPFKLPVPRRLAAGSVLFYEFTDLSGAPNTIQVALHGYEEVDEKTLSPLFLSGEKLWRNYVLIDETVAANATIDRNIVIDKSPNFVVTGILASFTSILMQMRIAESSNGRKNWTDFPIRGTNILGTAQYPFILPAPVYLNGNTVVYINLTEQSGVNNVIQMVLEGYEVQ